jgi:hypothetical protein
MARHRVELPWRLRFPTQRPGDAVPDDGRATARPVLAGPAGELDTPVPLAHPTYTAAVAADRPLTALTLTTHVAVLRAAVAGLLDACGAPEAQRRRLGGAGAAAFGHRLYVNDDVRSAVAAANGRRRRVLGLAYGAEVRRLAAWATETVARAADLPSATDGRLDATLGSLRDELAWFWAIAAVGAALDGDGLSGLDDLVTVLPGGASLAAAPGLRGDTLAGPAPRPSPPAGGRRSPSARWTSPARAQAERVALALGQALAAAVQERAARLAAAGVLKDADDAAHLTWDELLAPPPDPAGLIEARRAEHDRLAGLSLPATISVTGPAAALATDAVVGAP